MKSWLQDSSYGNDSGCTWWVGFQGPLRSIQEFTSHEWFETFGDIRNFPARDKPFETLEKEDIRPVNPTNHLSSISVGVKINPSLLKEVKNNFRSASKLIQHQDF